MSKILCWLFGHAMWENMDVVRGNYLMEKCEVCTRCGIIKYKWGRYCKEDQSK